MTYTGWLGKSHGTFVRANIATAQVKKLSDAQALGLTQKDMSHQCAVVMESDSASLQEQYDQLMALPVRPTGSSTPEVWNLAVSMRIGCSRIPVNGPKGIPFAI